ncbi:MAG: glutamate synthase-related protein, partial [Bacteroidota bacterium]
KLISLFVLVLLAVGAAIFLSAWWWILAFILGALWLLGMRNYSQHQHSILRNFPLVGHGRYLADWLRPKIYQYFVEPDTDGRPFNRIFRSIVYQRAKEVLDTAPFGTQLNVYDTGYEWMNHSIAAIDYDTLDQDPRVKIGGPACLQPYEASILNVAAMSYGSLSKNAILALNGGASIGGFAHNTGEGGISPYHEEYQGDLIYQIGTGYFGSRSPDGGFSPDEYTKQATKPNVKMIELKLSQGAKPGHGGILPAKKVTQEIANIRGVEMGQDVLSPPYHTAFSTPMELMHFIQQLRDLSGGKPVGFKLCIGNKSEFLAICKAMIETQIRPDFIAIDGGEGGTGAAPLEFSNSVGMPMLDGLAYASNALIGFDLKKDITLIASGKVVTGYHIYRALALGADACYSARAMMMALGCIQALECNKNSCPVGVTTNDPHLMRGLVVKDKKHRVASFHRETVHSFVELMGASGHQDLQSINRADITRRTENNESLRYDQIYPYITRGCLLESGDCPASLRADYAISSPHQFKPVFEVAYEA